MQPSNLTSLRKNFDLKIPMKATHTMQDTSLRYYVFDQFDLFFEDGHMMTLTASAN